MVQQFYSSDTDPVVILPHKEIPWRTWLIVETALRKAWEIVVTAGRPEFDWRTAHEDDLTLELFETLKDQIFCRGIIPGFDQLIFSSINREPKVRNFDRSHPDKMPDLLIEFVQLPIGAKRSQHGIFIECKPVDHEHSAGTHYCTKGIRRFLDGEYAWAMQDALMLAYARPSHRIVPKLPEALDRHPREDMRSIEPIAVCPQSTGGELFSDVFTTVHQRSFSYKETKQAAPPIHLRHLWLTRN
jgi:hypothetical protein